MKILVMSATFPKSIDEIFSRCIKHVVKKFLLDEYKKLKRIKIETSEEDITNNGIIAQIKEKFEEKRNKNGSILVICNTVKKAREVYKKLKNHFKNEVILLHAKFIYKERCEREEKISKLLNEKKSFILIATQVAEVSLDVSFDYLFTECAPLPSLIQRFGRVNRYGKVTQETNITVTYPSEVKKREKEYPYLLEEIEKTFFLLKKNFEGDKLKSELSLITSYDVYLPKHIQQEIETKFSEWERNHLYFYSWRIGDINVQKYFKLRDEITKLSIPYEMQEIAEDLSSKLVDAIKERKKVEIKELFAAIKNLTLPAPIWCEVEIIENVPFPIIKGLSYDETGLKPLNNIF